MPFESNVSIIYTQQIKLKGQITVSNPYPILFYPHNYFQNPKHSDHRS